MSEDRGLSVPGGGELPERFWARVEKTDLCWNWTGSLNRNGYGSFSFNGKTQRAHRVAYEQLVGPIPDGLCLDHLCRNRRCVSPAHLDPVTDRENILRGFGAPAQNARKSHCANGHEFTPENTIYPSHRPGERECRACKRKRRREEAARHRAERQRIREEGGARMPLTKAQRRRLDELTAVAERAEGVARWQPVGPGEATVARALERRGLLHRQGHLDYELRLDALAAWEDPA